MSTKTTCPYCGVGCGVLVDAAGKVSGDPDHPANFGRLCSKGSALGETIDLEGRLLAPMIAGERSDWETALDLVTDKFRAAIRDHGPESVAFYVSGQLLTEDYYVANKLMKGFIGSANIDTNSRLCMASSVAGHKRAFGADVVPCSYEDLEEADLVVLTGSNLAWCHPVLFQRIAAAKAARPQMQIVTIDPRETATSALSDLHLAVAPDGDIALFNGLLAHLAETGAVDAHYVARHVNGFDETLARARATDSAQSGISPAQREAFYHLWAQTPKVVTVYSQGVNQSTSGTDKVNAIINCHLATGRIGQRGAGPFSVTGQPNAMGGREVGGLANMLANHLDIENADHRAAVQAFWQSPTICTQAGLKAVDLFKACESGQIKALWVISTNPAVSMPDTDQVVRALKAVPFVVVSDIMARTDTGDLADVLLPAAGWGEKSGTVTNSERRISRQRAFLPVPAQARPDWQILCQFAAKMGWGAAFSYCSPAEIFREYAALTAVSQHFGRALDLTGLADLAEAEYRVLAPAQWPVPQAAVTRSSTRFFGEGGFFHADQRARMIPVFAPEMRQSAGSFRLNTGRIRDQWHTMTRSGKSPRLSAHLAEPFVEIHPDDAAALNFKPAELVEISAGRARGLFRALITPRAPQGQLFAPMHWSRQNSRAGGVNILVPAEIDPISGQPALKAGDVRARRYAATWYGYLATRGPVDVQILGARSYGATARTGTGYQTELASREALDGSEALSDLLRALTGILDGEIARYEDLASGQGRVALTRGGVIEALLFTSPDPVAISRQAVIASIGTDQPAAMALAGRAAVGARDDGAIVCACFSVGANVLAAAVAAGAGSVVELGERTCAGTNCGSCKPELAAFLNAKPVRLAAE